MRHRSGATRPHRAGAPRTVAAQLIAHGRTAGTEPRESREFQSRWTDTAHAATAPGLRVALRLDRFGIDFAVAGWSRAKIPSGDLVRPSARLTGLRRAPIRQPYAVACRAPPPSAASSQRYALVRSALAVLDHRPAAPTAGTREKTNHYHAICERLPTTARGVRRRWLKHNCSVSEPPSRNSGAPSVTFNLRELAAHDFARSRVSAVAGGDRQLDLDGCPSAGGAIDLDRATDGLDSVD